MGRIFFLSAVAFLAYKYIARSNQKHQLDSADKSAAVLPPAPPPPVKTLPAASVAAPEPQPKLVAAGSRAVEPEPTR